MKKVLNTKLLICIAAIICLCACSPKDTLPGAEDISFASVNAISIKKGIITDEDGFAPYNIFSPSKINKLVQALNDVKLDKDNLYAGDNYFEELNSITYFFTFTYKDSSIPQLFVEVSDNMVVISDDKSSPKQAYFLDDAILAEKVAEICDADNRIVADVEVRKPLKYDASKYVSIYVRSPESETTFTDDKTISSITEKLNSFEAAHIEETKSLVMADYSIRLERLDGTLEWIELDNLGIYVVTSSESPKTLMCFSPDENFFNNEWAHLFRANSSK